MVVSRSATRGSRAVQGDCPTGRAAPGCTEWHSVRRLATCPTTLHGCKQERDQGVARSPGGLPHWPGCARLHRVALGAQVGNLPHLIGQEAGPTWVFTSRAWACGSRLLLLLRDWIVPNRGCCRWRLLRGFHRAVGRSNCLPKGRAALHRHWLLFSH